MLSLCQNKLATHCFNGRFYSPNVKQQLKLLFPPMFHSTTNETFFFRTLSKMTDHDPSTKGNHSNVSLPIYLDAQATTKPHPDVLNAMWPYFTEKYGNCHSKTHIFGWEAEKAVEIAREKIATLINASPKEIIFTSGATECNNMALKGVAQFYGSKKNHIITVQTEHKCVLDSCRALSEKGFNITYLPVDKNGHIDLENLKNTITTETLIVSVMTINNEIGVIHPIKEIGQICREKNVYFHTDAAQAFGKIPIDVNECNIDLMSMSAHKIYGPKGVGALYIRNKPRVRLVPMFSGGGQERGLRSGTLPVPLVVGFGEAAHLATENMQENYDKIEYLSERLVNGITTKLTHVVRNGDPNLDGGYPGCVNFSFACVEGESLLMALKDIALSSGSACTSASLEPSYVLRAIGADEDLAHSSIRFGICIFTTEAEIDYVVDRVVEEVARLRQMSPLWEMIQEGIDLKTIDWGEKHQHQ